MASFSYERRSGYDRRSGGDRRQLDRRQVRDVQEKGEQEEDLEKVSEMTAHLGEVWYAKGKDLYERNKHEDARKALNKAVEIKPDIADAWFLLACIDSIKGEKSKTLSLLTKAVVLAPDYKEKAKANAAFKKLRGDGDFEKAVQ